MKVGPLSDRITIQEMVRAKDEWGQPVDNWVDLVSVWADVRFQNGKEFIAADREVAQTQVSIRIRKRTVNTAMQVIFEGKTYGIKAVLPDSSQGSIDLVCQELV